ncbi:hypothetical protein Syun_025561 [Stephania yunnanensis]|uniref:Uncharacterized protein n=1 Tax=Stephania yunnanensis TaxID=152371 RepID=A0AAP0ESI4_9MAGN
MGEIIMPILKKKLPHKCNNLGMFSVPFVISDVSIQRAMCDLGISINVMSFSIFETLNACLLEEIGIVI